ncbi:MAG TPA: hypothetical protein VIK06_05400 [Candidatus Limnocylindrales bacterium]|jgi:photosystem II stability/assembly factor-like uncharacterized protein
MNRTPSEDRGGIVERRIGEWADLSATSRPPGARAQLAQERVAESSPERPRSRRSAPGLALVLLAVLVITAVGFGLSSWQSSVAPSASGSASATSVESINQPPSVLASPGSQVAALQHIDEMNGWAYVWNANAQNGTQGLALMMTNDAGLTWRDATPPGATGQPVIEFLDADHGWFLGNDAGPLWRTTNGGRSWQKTTLPTGRSGFGAAMSFISASTGYLLLSAATSQSAEPWSLYRTDDGGASLQPVGAVKLPNEPPLSGPPPMIAFSDELDGLVAGWSAVLQTHDGGLTWTSARLPAGQGSAAARYIGVDQLRVFGARAVLVAWMENALTNVDAATPYVSDDAGRTWRQASEVSSQTTSDIWDVVDASTWLGFGSPVDGIHMRVTSDAGRTWTDSTGVGPPGLHIMAVSFTALFPGHGWAIFQVDSTCPPEAACPGLPPAGQLADTRDGGATWQLGK